MALFKNDKAHAVYIGGRLIPAGEAREVNASLIPLDQEMAAQPAPIPPEDIEGLAGELMNGNEDLTANAALFAEKAAAEAALLPPIDPAAKTALEAAANPAVTQDAKPETKPLAAPEKKADAKPK